MVNEWNSLDLEARTCTTLGTFKTVIRHSNDRRAKIDLQELPRFASILYTKIQYSCSALMDHLYRYRIVDSPMCACHLANESTFHFFWDCPLYDVPRARLIHELTTLAVYDLTVNSLLNCARRYPAPLVMSIQKVVCKVIISSRRF